MHVIASALDSRGRPHSGKLHSPPMKIQTGSSDSAQPVAIAPSSFASAMEMPITPVTSIVISMPKRQPRARVSVDVNHLHT